ncbi:MAG: ABC transporter permease [Acidimicrobiales bacterium]|nr:ABC transporter permease [Acidimicrobiales bacterium]
MIALVTRRALLDYARRPLNLVFLVAVPVVIVVALAGELTTFSKLLNVAAKPVHLEVATAGWAAAAVAGLAGFFQVLGSRDADRRLAAVSGRATPVVVGRLGAAGALAVAAAAAATVALAARAGITDPFRVLSVVLLVAVTFMAIGVLVGTLVRSEMNGALIVTFIWMLNVFVGAGSGGGSSFVARIFPLHFPTQVLIGQASGHSGPIGDVGWSLLWAIGLSALAVARLASTTRATGRKAVEPGSTPASTMRSPVVSTVASPPVTSLAQPRSPVVVTPATASLLPADLSTVRPRAATRLVAGSRAAARDYGRNRVLWVLLIVVPVAFIALAAEQTPTKLMPVALVAGARHFTAMISLRQVHAAEMASVASALLAGIAGLFVVTGSTDGDRRLVLAGFRPREVLVGHLGVVAGAAVLISATSLAVSAAWISPQQWAVYAGADVLIALTYAMIGMLLGPLTGRLGGLYLILLLTLVDVGYGQTVMYNPIPPTWGAFLPARGAGRLLIDGAFSLGLSGVRYLLLALGWLAVLTAGAAVTFRFRIGKKVALAVVTTQTPTVPPLIPVFDVPRPTQDTVIDPCTLVPTEARGREPMRTEVRP